MICKRRCERAACAHSKSAAFASSALALPCPGNSVANLLPTVGPHNNSRAVHIRSWMHTWPTATLIARNEERGLLRHSEVGLPPHCVRLCFAQNTRPSSFSLAPFCYDVIADFDVDTLPSIVEAFERKGCCTSTGGSSFLIWALAFPLRPRMKSDRHYASLV